MYNGCVTREADTAPHQNLDRMPMASERWVKD